MKLRYGIFDFQTFSTSVENTLPTNLFAPRNKVEVGWAVWEERWSQPASTHHSELPWFQKRHPLCSETILRMFIVTKESGTFGRFLLIPSSAIKKKRYPTAQFFLSSKFPLPESKFCRNDCLPLCFPPRRLSGRDWRKVSFVDTKCKQATARRRDLQHNSTTQQHCKLWYNTTTPQSIEWCQERPAASGEPIFPMQFRRNLWRS